VIHIRELDQLLLRVVDFVRGDGKNFLLQMFVGCTTKTQGQGIQLVFGPNSEGPAVRWWNLVSIPMAGFGECWPGRPPGY